MRHIIGLICLAAFFALLITGCSKAPGSVIEDFYNAKTWDERKAFILDANGLKEKDIYDEEADYKVNEITLLKSIDDKSSIYRIVLMKTKSGIEEKQIRKFIITRVGDVEKIDFKTMLGYNEISLKDYIQNKSTAPQKLWMGLWFNNKEYIYPFGDVDNIEIIDPWDRERASIIIPEDKCPEDLIKLKSIAMKNRTSEDSENNLVLIEISGEIIKGLAENIILPKQVKFVKLNPLAGE